MSDLARVERAVMFPHGAHGGKLAVAGKPRRC
jgi:hypothetical protein